MPVTYPVIFTQAARRELIEAQDWYEREVTGVGRRFREATDALVRRMSQNPLQFPVVFKHVRRALLRPLPYSLFFVIEQDASLPAAIRRTGKGEHEALRKHKVW